MANLAAVDLNMSLISPINGFLSDCRFISVVTFYILYLVWCEDTVFWLSGNVVDPSGKVVAKSGNIDPEYCFLSEKRNQSERTQQILVFRTFRRPPNPPGPRAAASAGALSVPMFRYLFTCISSPVILV